MILPSKCAAILVVEDHADIREMVTEFLEGEGFRVYAAENGQVALEVLGRIPQPALILADLMMPVMDGPALIRALRADDQLASLPVVVISATNEFAPPGVRHVKKPVRLRDLLRIVEELCERST